MPLTAVAIARVSYAVSATAPPAGRRLRRLQSDGYSTLLVRVTLLSAAAATPTHGHGSPCSGLADCAIRPALLC